MRSASHSFRSKVLACVCAGGSLVFGGMEQPKGPKARAYLRSLPIGAFVDAVSLDSLANLVVTDTKTAQPQESVTQKLEIITIEDIGQQTTPNRNLAELLMSASGQFVNVLSRNDANWGSYAGLGPKYNSWLLDGLPMDSFADAMSLDPWAFDRIEVHKGPASVLYSNVLTMDFAGNEMPLAGITNFMLKEKIDAPATRFRLERGNWNTTGGRLYHQGRQGGFHYLMGANIEKSDYTDYGSPNSWLGMQRDPGYEKTKVFAKATSFIGDHQFSLFAHRTQHLGEVGRPNRDYRHAYETLNLDYAWTLSPTLNLRFKAGYRSYDRNWTEDNFPADLGLREWDGVRQTLIPLDLTFNLQHGDHALLTVGADWQKARFHTSSEVNGRSRTGNDTSAQSMGFFLQEKLALGSWILRAGVRINRTQHNYHLFDGGPPPRDSNTWTRTLFSLGLRKNFGDGASIYWNIGNGFLAPSVQQLGGSLQESDLGLPGKHGRLPNLDLLPEKALGTDLGWNLQPGSGWNVSTRIFFYRIQDAIVENIVSVNPSQSRSMNAGRAQSFGTELSIEHILNPSLQWFANWTWTRTRIQNPMEANQDGAEIPFGPRSLLNAGLTVDLAWAITLTPTLQAVGRYFDSTSLSNRRRFGSDLLVHLKLHKSLLQRSDTTLNLVLDLNNLGNKRIERPWQFRDPGFNLLAAIQLNF